MFGNQKLTPSQRLDKAVIAIMGHNTYIALSGVLMVGERKTCNHIPNFPAGYPQTAMTDGRDEWYNNDFVDSLIDAELRGLIIHENYHKMYRHTITWQNLHKVNPHLCAKACDYSINIRIADENPDGFAVLPKGGLIDERFRDMNAAQIFKELQKDQKGDGKSDGSGSGKGKGEGEANVSPTDAHDFDGAQQLSEEEQNALEREIDEAIRQGALTAAATGSGGLRSIDELMEPKVDWREALRDFITSTCAGNDYSTWRAPSKRYVASGLYMPRGVSEQVDDLCIDIDMSGSTWNIVPQFMAELKAMLEHVSPRNIRLIYWDTKVCREEVYEFDQLDQLMNITKPSGGGGTRIQCVPNYCNEHGVKPQAHIVLTDGELFGGWGNGWNAPVFWCIVDNKDARPSHGKYVNINSGSI